MNNHIFRALSEKSFLFLWLGELFTQIAGNIFNFFLILIVFELTHSNTAVSGIVVSFTIPAILFGSFAGAYVDRWNKKHVLIITNVLRAILLVILAFSLHNLIVVYTVSFLFALFTQFFIPAETPMIPLVVQKDKLYSANALFGMAIYGSVLLAYVIVGPLLIFLKPIGTTLILAGMLLLGSVFISFVTLTYSKMKEMLEEMQETNILRDIHHTLKLVSRTKSVYHSLFLLALSQILILIVATIAPGYATSVLGIRVEDFSWLFVTPAAIGMVLGAIGLINYFHAHPKNRLITVGIFVSGLAMLLLPFGSKVASRDIVHTINGYLPQFLKINILHIMTVLAFLLGFANALVFVPANTILQESTSEEFRGKVYGFLNTMVGVVSLVPVIAVGGLSDLIGVGNVIVGIGVALLLLAFGRLFIKY
jgi:MFS family permease